MKQSHSLTPSGRLSLGGVIGIFLTIIGCVPSTTFANEFPTPPPGGTIVVANRGSASLSVIDPHSVTVVATVPLPTAVNRPEPMYVVEANTQNQFFVGDRANNRVVVFDAGDFTAQGEITVGAGVWHMWADARNRQLWVNGDIDRTTTVIDVQTHAVLAVVPTPADLIALGGKPHDVFVEADGQAAFVSVVGVAGAADYVVRFDTATFAETGRAAVGKDPHLSISKQENLLFVPCQGGNRVVVLDPTSMVELKSIPVPGAHGAGMTKDGKTFYTSNLPGLGVNGLFTIDTRTGSILGAAVQTPFAVPHNIALTPAGDRLFLTHSIPTATKVTVYAIDPASAAPVFLKTVDVGLNPFGIAYLR